MKVMAFIDIDGHMVVIDISTVHKARTYIDKCLVRIKERALAIIEKEQNSLDNLGYTEEDISGMPEVLKFNAEYPFRTSGRKIKQEQETLEEIKEVWDKVSDLNDVDEIFEYLLEESPFVDYFVMDHRGQSISEVKDPEHEDFPPSIPNF